MPEAPIPPLQIPEYRPYIKLEIVKDARDGDVVYTKGHIIEVFVLEANALIAKFPDVFVVVSN